MDILSSDAAAPAVVHNAGQNEKLLDLEQAAAHTRTKLRFGSVLQEEPGLQSAAGCRVAALNRLEALQGWEVSDFLTPC